MKFACKDLPGNINQSIIREAFPLEIVPETEVEETAIERILTTENFHTVVVDHYQLGIQWEQRTRKLCKRLLAIDDIARTHHADLLLDQNFRPVVPANYISSKSKLFVGPSYCLLGASYLNLCPLPRNFSQVNEVVVFFGGSDPGSDTLQILPSLLAMNEKIRWHILLGESNKDKKEIEAIVSKAPNIKLHIAVPYVRDLLLQSDLYVGAGGTITWERAYLGLPSIVISVASNQEEVNEGLGDLGAIHYLGKRENVSDVEIQQAIHSLINGPKKREQLSQKSLKLGVASKLEELIDQIVAGT